MNRKLIAWVGFCVIAFGAWLFAVHRRGDGDAATAGSGSGRTGEIKLDTAKPHDAAAPRGMAPRWELDIDPEGPLRLEGQVVGPDGQGVGDAEVSIDSVPKRTTKTEGDGSFAFDKLVGRGYSVWAEHADMVGGPVEIKLAATSDPVVVRLVKGEGVTVTVDDEGGKPIAGAEVTVNSKREHAVKTGDDGVATVSPVHSGWFSASATAPGYAPGQTFGSVASHGTGHAVIKLHKGVAIAGRVIDETGKPIGKAHVSVAGMFGNSAGDDVVTDPKGQFSIIAASTGTRALSVTDGEHAPAKSAPITVGDRPVTGVEITMQAGGVVAGRVIDTDGAAVPFATVRISSSGGQMMWAGASRQATTDRAGTFTLRGLARTKLTARAESDLAASKVVDVDLHDTAERKGLELRLDVRGTISGVVTDETGQAVGEVQVNAFPDLLSDGGAQAEALAGMSSAHTDGAGAFTIRGLPDGAYKLWASRGADGDRGWGETGTKAKAGDRDVKITLAAPGSITGTIEIAGSSAAPTLANIQVGYQPATAVDKGVIKVDDVTPGTYDVRLRGVDFAEHVLKGVKIDPGKATDLGTITVTRGRRVTGKVVDATGSPVAGATVKIGNMLFSIAGADDVGDNLDDMSGIRNGTSDQDGSFSLIGVPPQSVSIAASDPVKGQSPAQRLAAGTDDPPPVTLTLKGYGAIVGKVTMASQPQSGVTITDSVKEATGAQIAVANTEADGTFSLPKVPEGTHVLNAMQSKGFGMSLSSTTATVIVVAGQTATVAIDIPVGKISLTVQIAALPGNQVDSAQVFLFSGTVAVTNAQDLTQGFLQSGIKGMKFWFGKAASMPVFDALTAGDYSVCSVPITGDLSDSTFQQRLQQNMNVLKVYCQPVKLADSPAAQTVTQSLPTMATLPK